LTSNQGRIGGPAVWGEWLQCHGGDLSHATISAVAIKMTPLARLTKAIMKNVHPIASSSMPRIAR
jgi:hypothetical protein